MGEIMGLLDKVKNLFTEPEDSDDEIQIEQIKKEGSKISIEPKRTVIPKVEKKIELDVVKEEKIEEKKEKELDDSFVTQEQPTISRSITREQVKTPIFFTEDEFADLEPEKPVRVESKKSVESKKIVKKEEKKQPYSGGGYTSTSIFTKEKPSFKPTPIISPIYGILDKNYSKDDIVERKDIRKSNAQNVTTSDKFDEVRNKAYGMDKLENDLESTMYEEPKKKRSSNKRIEEEIDLFDELENDKKEENKYSVSDTTELAKTVNEQEKNIQELEEVTMDLTKELDNLLLKKESYNKRSKKKLAEDELLTENEVFNFIDSIYEDGKE